MPSRSIIGHFASRAFQDGLVSQNPNPRLGPFFWNLISRLNGAFSTSRDSSSSTRWRARQGRDRFVKAARVQDLKSRAAFKLLEINEKYDLFKPGNTVVDLGYAPGSWSQVAIDRTAPNGRVVGIDIIPAQPPRGVSTIQGNFLSEEVQAEVRAYVRDPDQGRPRKYAALSAVNREAGDQPFGPSEKLEKLERSYVDMGKRAHLDVERTVDNSARPAGKLGVAILSRKKQDELDGRVVDVVLSDMSAPWDQTDGFHKNIISNPYHRMMNTSGVPYRDHTGSMDLCLAALSFSFDTLKAGGHFVCKFYQGAEDKALEKTLSRLFERIHREKPESSRAKSKEAYFVALRRKFGIRREEVFD